MTALFLIITVLGILILAAALYAIHDDLAAMTDVLRSWGASEPDDDPPGIA